MIVVVTPLNLIFVCVVMMTGQDGWTPLHCAADNGHTEAVKMLVDAGANKEAVTTKVWNVVEIYLCVPSFSNSCVGWEQLFYFAIVVVKLLFILRWLIVLRCFCPAYA